MNRILIRLALVGLVLLGPAAGTAPGGEAPVPRAEVDPALRALLRRSDAEAVALRALPAAGLSRPAFLRSHQPEVAPADPEWLELFVTWEGAPPAPGPDLTRIAFTPEIDGVRTTLPRLRELLGADRVRRVRLARPVRPLLDRSGEYLGLPAVRRLDPATLDYVGITGRNVAVGVVDTGLDFDHPDFQNAVGSTRVATYWDQGAPPPRPAMEYGFGREYSGFEVDHGVARSRDTEGHGTHVLGIAAGNGFADVVPGEGPRYPGVAPEAVLMPVRTLFSDYAVASGVHFVFARAEALGIPAVVNLSLGSHFGPHDGSTPFEKALSAMVRPGKLIVVAAGNSADDADHAELRFDDGLPQTLSVRFPRYPGIDAYLPFVDVEGWHAAGDRYRVTVRDPGGTEMVAVVYGDEEIENSGPRGLARAWNVADLGRGSILVEMEAVPGSQLRATGTWTITVEPVGGTRGEVDFWITGWYTGGDENPVFEDHVDREESLTVPGTAHGLITVGAVSTRSCWTRADGAEECYGEPAEPGDVAGYSGLGPTGDGRDKPDILAPGNGVVSALSSVLSPAVADESLLSRLRTPDGRYWILRGTSMAAPQVTGAVALLLERHPALDHVQAVTRLTLRAAEGIDPRTGRSVRVLRIADAVLPSAQLVSADAVVAGDGIHVRWAAGKELPPVEYAVHRGFSDTGPFDRLAGTRIGGRNPYEVVDRHPEPGRTHVYRIAVVDRWGMSDDLDTLRVSVPGRPASILRAPDPNPARDRATFRYYVAPAPGSRAFRVDVLDVAGRLVRPVDAGEVAPGAGAERLASWDLRDAAGSRVGAGVYWVRLALSPAGSDDGVLIRRVTVLP